MGKVRRKRRLILALLVGLGVGALLGRLIQPGVIVWEHVGPIAVGESFELEIESEGDWPLDDRWRLYTLDMAVDPFASERPVVSFGHDGDLELAVFEGRRHNDKVATIPSVSGGANRLVYKVPFALLKAQPTRLWLWSGDTGYRFRVNGVPLKERASWRLTEDNPYFYYTLDQQY